MRYIRNKGVELGFMYLIEDLLQCHLAIGHSLPQLIQNILIIKVLIQAGILHDF